MFQHSSKTMNSGDALLVTIQVSKHLYVFQNTVLFFVIYNAVEGEREEKTRYHIG